MRPRPSSLIGPAVGLLLATALLVRQADPTALQAQGLSSLLRASREAFETEGEQPGAAGAQNVFVALHEALERAARPSLSTTLTLDSRVPDAEHAPAFSRGVDAALNIYGAWRIEQGLAALTRGDDGAVQLLLDVQTAPEAVQLAGRVLGGGVERPVASQAPWIPPGRGSLFPPLLAILVALFFRRTVLALFVGIASGAVLMAAGPDGSLLAAIPTGLLGVFTHYFRNEVVDSFRIEIIGFVVALIAMVGVMSRGGGVQGLIELLLRFARSVRSTLAVTWGMGLLVFFDDYANCLLVGSTMRPLTDRMRVSREKLAYIVDSTAAPIAGLSLLSTWIAFEVSTYSAQLPGVGITESAYAIFLRTIPFRFYCLFTIGFVALVIFTRRDFGPMLKAERRARSTGQLVRPGGAPLVSDEMTRIVPREGMPLRWQDALLPIVCVLAVTMVRIFTDGGGLAMWTQDRDRLFSGEGLRQILFEGSGAGPIFVGAACGLVLATFLVASRLLRAALLAGLAGAWLLAPMAEPLLAARMDAKLAGYLAVSLAFAAAAGGMAALLQRAPWHETGRAHLPWADIRQAAVSSTRALFFAVVILFEAWMIGAVCRDLGTADYLVALMSGSMPPVLLPVLLFVVSCMVAFATGSSWSTMSILLPNVVALAWVVGATTATGGDTVAASMAMLVMCIGAVLEGSIFGDHCSPISDTTVLSSVSSASDHVDHVRTQAPYALVTAGAAVVAGYVPSLLFSWWSFGLSMVAGLGLLLAVLLVFGRRVPEATPEPAVAVDPAAGAEASTGA